MIMFNVQEIEKTISCLRTQAAQLEATALMLEASIQPLKQYEQMLKLREQFAQSWMLPFKTK